MLFPDIMTTLATSVMVSPRWPTSPFDKFVACMTGMHQMTCQACLRSTGLLVRNMSKIMM